MSKTLTVIAPAAFIRLTGGTAVLLVEGQPVPSSAEPDDVKRLTAEKYLGEVETAEADDTPPEMKAGDDPGQFTAQAVDAYLATADEAEKSRVLTAEAAGKNRKSLTGGSGS